MKKRALLSLIVIMVFFVNTRAQSNESISNYNGNQIAKKIAKKVADTLNLTANQRQQIQTINVQLHNRKMIARALYPGQDSILTVQIQLVEKTRDSLYKPVLGTEKYKIYKQKKFALISNN